MKKFLIARYYHIGADTMMDAVREYYRGEALVDPEPGWTEELAEAHQFDRLADAQTRVEQLKRGPKSVHETTYSILEQEAVPCEKFIIAMTKKFSDAKKYWNKASDRWVDFDDCATLFDTRAEANDFVQAVLANRFDKDTMDWVRVRQITVTNPADLAEPTEVPMTKSTEVWAVIKTLPDHNSPELYLMVDGHFTAHVTHGDVKRFLDRDQAEKVAKKMQLYVGRIDQYLQEAVIEAPKPKIVAQVTATSWQSFPLTEAVMVAYPIAQRDTDAYRALKDLCCELEKLVRYDQEKIHLTLDDGHMVMLAREKVFPDLSLTPGAQDVVDTTVDTAFDPKRLEQAMKYLDVKNDLRPHIAAEFQQRVDQEVQRAKIDAAVNPDHYKFGKVECIDAIETILSPTEYRGFLRGTIMAYEWRLGRKDEPLQEFKKAQWYAQRLLKLLEDEHSCPF